MDRCTFLSLRLPTDPVAIEVGGEGARVASRCVPRCWAGGGASWKCIDVVTVVEVDMALEGFGMLLLRRRLACSYRQTERGVGLLRRRGR